MNCPNCNAPLENNARFCPKCGQPISVANSNNATVVSDPRHQPLPGNESEPPTIPPGYLQVPPRQQQQPWSQSATLPPQQQPAWPQPQSQPTPTTPTTQSPPPSYNSSNRPDFGGNMFT